MTLMEVVIAMAIFVTFLVGALEAMVSMRNLATQHERTEDLENEGKKMVRTFTNDIANSAWFYHKPDAKTRTAVYPAVTKAVTGAYGDTLEFVKLRTERSVSSDPQNLHVEHVSFADSATKPVPFSNYHNAVAVNSLVLNETYLQAVVDSNRSTYWNDTYVAAVWESESAAQTFIDNADKNKVRVYRYDVQVNPSTGLGSLRRMYHNQQTGGTWQVAEILSDNILEFEVDLYNSSGSAAGLNMNQIRFRFVLERPGAGGVARSRRAVEAVIAMRSITNEASN
jgi:type II secretory pathway pseudopilin PulG